VKITLEERRSTRVPLKAGHLPIAAWKKPQFDPLKGEEVSEVRGYYGPTVLGRQVYTLLFGHDKQTRNDTSGKREATKRKRSIERGDAKTHKFEFYRASSQQDRKEPQGTH
jgi:hypothetical protein